MKTFAFAIAMLIATVAAAQQSDSPKSKTERCMEIADFKLAMACLRGIVVEHNREKMRKAIKAR